MEEKEILQEIIGYLQKRYIGFNEIYTITNQLQEAIGYDDVVTMRMLIRMRQQEMESMDKLNLQLQACLAQLTEEQKKAIKNGNQHCFLQENAAMLQRIMELQEKNRHLLERLIEQDERVNRKIAGEKSYYQTK